MRVLWTARRGQEGKGQKLRARREGVTEDEMVDGITDPMDMSLSKLRKLVVDREARVLQSMGSQRVRHD